jgi:hypothetical protein
MPSTRTYGGWRQARGLGLFGLTSAQLLVVLIATVATLIGFSFNLQIGLAIAPAAAIVISSFLLRWDGMPLSSALTRRVRWWWGSLRGHTEYRGGVIAAHPGAWQLPGVLAPTTLLSTDDGDGGSYGLVHHRGHGLMTATLRCASASTWLADRAEADTWVANWGGWLASLGHVPIVKHVAVTVDTAPDAGSTLTHHIRRRLDAAAPATARDIMAELVAVSPAAAADVDTRVSITLHPESSPSKPRRVEDAAAEVSRILPGLQSALAGCGVTVLGRASAVDLAAVVRTSFDPTAKRTVAEALAPTPADRWLLNESTEAPTDDLSVLSWEDAGPVTATEHHDHYQHDSGMSVSWAWHEAPRQHVHASVLARLLSPGPFPKRVTLLYRPLSAAAAARTLENEVNAASFRDAYRRKQGRDQTARDEADRIRAQQAAAEEAMGAGVCLVSMFVTVTVTDETHLPRAVADVEARADTAKIRLRRMYASQAAGFATTRPCGIAPPFLATRPLGAR